MDSKISWGTSLCKIHSSHPMQTLAVNAALRFRRHPAIAELHCMYQLWPPFYDSRYVNPNLVISSFSRTAWSAWKPESSQKTLTPFLYFHSCCHFYILPTYGLERHYWLLDASRKRNEPVPMTVHLSGPSLCKLKNNFTSSLNYPFPGKSSSDFSAYSTLLTFLPKFWTVVTMKNDTL